MPAQNTRGIPYMIDTDPMADVAEHIEGVASHVSAIRAGSNNVTVTASVTGTATVTFATPFPVGTVPVVVASAAFSDYVVAVQDVTRTNFKLQVRDVNNTARSIAVGCLWVAVLAPSA